MDSKILIIEDDYAIVENLKSALNNAGFDVAIAHSGVKALSAMTEVKPDVVVLDTKLGWLAVHPYNKGGKCGKADYPAPIIIFDPKTENTKEIQPIKINKGDSPSRTFDARAVVSKVKSLRSLLRTSTKTLYRAGNLELDEEQWKVTVNGISIALTNKEFGLLRILMRSKGRVLTRDMILQSEWGYSDLYGYESRTIDVHIGHLRQKLGPAGKYILTVRGIGYCLGITPEILDYEKEAEK